MNEKAESSGLLHEYWFGPPWPYACLMCGRRIADPNRLWCEACPVAIEDIVTRQVNPGHLPEAQGEVLKFVASYIKQNQISPSLDDIGESMGFSRQAAHYHIRALSGRGLVIRGHRSARAITLTDKGKAWLRVAASGQGHDTSAP